MPRPASLARYSARSALRSSVAAVARRPAARWRCRCWSTARELVAVDAGAAARCRRGLARPAGRSRRGRSPTVCSTTNSSPPSRATKWPRAACCTRCAGFDQQGVAGRMAERVVDALNWSRSRQWSANRLPLPLRRANSMVELLLEHRPVRQAGQHVIERELGDALLALRDLAGHFVETVASRASSSSPRTWTCTCSPDASLPAASSSRASGCVIWRAAFQVAMQRGSSRSE